MDRFYDGLFSKTVTAVTGQTSEGQSTLVFGLHERKSRSDGVGRPTAKQAAEKGCISPKILKYVPQWLVRNQSSCGPVSFVRGRRSLVVASTLGQCLRDTAALVSL